MLKPTRKNLLFISTMVNHMWKEALKWTLDWNNEFVNFNFHFIYEIVIYLHNFLMSKSISNVKCNLRSFNSTNFFANIVMDLNWDDYFMDSNFFDINPYILFEKYKFIRRILLSQKHFENYQNATHSTGLQWFITCEKKYYKMNIDLFSKFHSIKKVWNATQYSLQITKEVYHMIKTKLEWIWFKMIILKISVFTSLEKY